MVLGDGVFNEHAAKIQKNESEKTEDGQWNPDNVIHFLIMPSHGHET